MQASSYEHSSKGINWTVSLMSQLITEQGNLVLSTEFITWIGHRKEFKSWSFER